VPKQNPLDVMVILCLQFWRCQFTALEFEAKINYVELDKVEYEMLKWVYVALKINALVVCKKAEKNSIILPSIRY
jgi:hypothetical protein